MRIDAQIEQQVLHTACGAQVVWTEDEMKIIACKTAHKKKKANSGYRSTCSNV
jgi:hypothetical protein